MAREDDCNELGIALLDFAALVDCDDDLPERGAGGFRFAMKHLNREIGLRKARDNVERLGLFRRCSPGGRTIVSSANSSRRCPPRTRFRWESGKCRRIFELPRYRFGRE